MARRNAEEEEEVASVQFSVFREEEEEEISE
jgi:hypothetical protein